MKIRYVCVLILVGRVCVAQNPESLRSLIAEARRSNPAIQAAQRAVETSGYRPSLASAFPDTELMVQHFTVGSPRPFAGYSNSDFAYIGVGAFQEIPYPGKRGLRAKVARHESAIAGAEKSAVTWDVLTRLKLTYLQLAASQEILATLDKNRRVADEVERAVEARYRVGEGTQQDVLRAQLQRTRLLNEVAIEQRGRAQAQIVLKALLNRPAQSPDIVAEPLSRRNLPSLETLLAKLRENNPELQINAHQIAQEQAAVELAKRERKPDFGVQYMWQHTADNFRDYYQGTFSIRLPNRSRVRAAEGEAQARLAQTEAEKQSRLKQMESDLGEQFTIAQSAEQQLKTYEDGLVPQSEAALNAGLATYRTGKQEYQGLLAAFADTLQLAIERERLLAEHESAIARIEGLIGEEVP
ncbi:MAG TPA: TolC family protein [Terriglobales bacterium]|nr:TolC family protein [Terriglobales bacterium]